MSEGLSSLVKFLEALLEVVKELETESKKQIQDLSPSNGGTLKIAVAEHITVEEKIN